VEERRAYVLKIANKLLDNPRVFTRYKNVLKNLLKKIDVILNIRIKKIKKFIFISVVIIRDINIFIKSLNKHRV